ncbi:MAG TPA: hypothetical protein VGI39_13210 [Polyangiaceae bacterium]|jgi:hypothetical protein
MCPRCGRNAPVVYRGIVAYCTACGAPRPPLTGSSLHLAGQPSRVGGVVANVFGWLALFITLVLALVLGGLANLFFGAVGALVVGLPVALLGFTIGVLLIRSGNRMGQQGATSERAARTQAVFALASHKGGALTPLDVAQALDIGVAAADELLGALAREQPERVATDVDATGTLLYRFDVNTRQRIDPEIAHSPNREEWERLEALEAERAARARQSR